jgi:DmsE family decaheme c-type cytochrome
MRRTFLLPVLATALVAGAALAGGVPTYGSFEIPADAAYVGAAACVECHEDVADRYAGSPHAPGLDVQVPGSAAAACEACHGPGSLHVEGGGDGFILGAAILRDADEDVRTAMCTQCHTGTGSHWEGGPHQGSGITCADCHRDVNHFGGMARPAREYRNPSDFCIQCHADQVTDFRLPFRHRALEGQVVCGDCHDPHGRAGALDWNGTNGVCLKCHAEMAGPFVFEHDGTTGEDCTSCHRPHGSNHDKLLVQDGNTLCLQCHFGSSFGSDDNWTVGGTAHGALLGNEGRCYDCHSEVHGSNVSPTFRNQ